MSPCRFIHIILCNRFHLQMMKEASSLSLKLLGNLRNKTQCFSFLRVDSKLKTHWSWKGITQKQQKKHFCEMLQIYLLFFHSKILKAFTLSFSCGYPVKSSTGKDMPHFSSHNRTWSTGQKNEVWKSPIMWSINGLWKENSKVSKLHVTQML